MTILAYEIRYITRVSQHLCTGFNMLQSSFRAFSWEDSLKLSEYIRLYDLRTEINTCIRYSPQALQ